MKEIRRFCLKNSLLVVLRSGPSTGRIRIWMLRLDEDRYDRHENVQDSPKI